MTEYLDNNFDAFGITRTTMDIPTIEETDSERTISYNRLPSKAWLYLFTQTQSILIVNQDGGGAKAIATCANIDVATLMDKKIEFKI